MTAARKLPPLMTVDDVLSLDGDGTVWSAHPTVLRAGDALELASVAMAVPVLESDAGPHRVG